LIFIRTGGRTTSKNYRANLQEELQGRTQDGNIGQIGTARGYRTE